MVHINYCPNSVLSTQFTYKYKCDIKLPKTSTHVVASTRNILQQNQQMYNNINAVLMIAHDVKACNLTCHSGKN